MDLSPDGCRLGSMAYGPAKIQLQHGGDIRGDLARNSTLTRVGASGCTWLQQDASSRSWLEALVLPGVRWGACRGNPNREYPSTRIRWGCTLDACLSVADAAPPIESASVLLYSSLDDPRPGPTSSRHGGIVPWGSTGHLHRNPQARPGLGSGTNSLPDAAECRTDF
jgi:hypothetical protein